MTASVLQAPAGTRGFDCNTPLSTKTAGAFARSGYKFAVRYVPRITQRDIDLTAVEVSKIHEAGLGVMAVQHVESEDGWTPTASKGAEYGIVAGRSAQSCKLGLGTMVWLDLEGVKPLTPAQAIIDYCNKWHDAVGHMGFTPGLYVGWHAGLSASQLYNKLRFEHYWAAYNLNTDQQPALRGVQMKQGAPKSAEVPAGISFAIDTNVVQADKLGGLPLVWAPSGWLE